MLSMSRWKEGYETASSGGCVFIFRLTSQRVKVRSVRGHDRSPRRVCSCSSSPHLKRYPCPCSWPTSPVPVVPASFSLLLNAYSIPSCAPGQSPGRESLALYRALRYIDLLPCLTNLRGHQVEGYGRVVSRIAVTLGGSGEGDMYHCGWLGLFSRRCLYCTGCGVDVFSVVDYCDI
jgi:hypothetical protein